MSTGSWPLDLFFLCSTIMIAIAVGAYVAGDVRERRNR